MRMYCVRYGKFYKNKLSPRSRAFAISLKEAKEMVAKDGYSFMWKFTNPHTIYIYYKSNDDSYAWIDSVKS